MSYVSPNLRLFHVLNLSVIGFQFFSAHVSGVGVSGHVGQSGGFLSNQHPPRASPEDNSTHRTAPYRTTPGLPTYKGTVAEVYLMNKPCGGYAGQSSVYVHGTYSLPRLWKGPAAVLF